MSGKRSNEGFVRQEEDAADDEWKDAYVDVEYGAEIPYYQCCD